MTPKLNNWICLRYFQMDFLWIVLFVFLLEYIHWNYIGYFHMSNWKSFSIAQVMAWISNILLAITLPKDDFNLWSPYTILFVNVSRRYYNISMTYCKTAVTPVR